MPFKDLIYLIYLACLFLSAATASYYRKALKSRQLSIFEPYLWYVTVQEISVFLYRRLAEHPKTDIVYNLYRPITLCVLTWFFYHIPFNAPVRKLMLWIVSLYMAIIVFTFVFLHSAFVFNAYLGFAAALVFTSCGLFTLYNYFSLDNQAEEEKWRPVVWIVTGIIIFYPVVNISFAFHKHITSLNATIFGALLYNSMPQIMSLFMYSCFIYAFYLCQKKN